MGKKCFICKIKYGSFAFSKESNEIYCLQHKLAGMENVKKNKCITCATNPARYANVGEVAKYCGNCKQEGMIDVTHKKCIVCKEKPQYYNYIGKKLNIAQNAN